MPNLIIVVGGTGKSVAAVYLRLARFFGQPADILVIDMPFGGEEIDKQLDQLGVKQADFITPWPGGTTSLEGVKFAKVIGLDSGDVARPVAKALFAEDELDILVEKGMNARPIVGATVAMRKFWGSQQDPQLSDLRQRVAQYNDIFLVGSIAGGTGSGVMPTLGRWLTEVCHKRVHGILFLPWINIGAGVGDGPSDAVMQANAHAVLSYLKQVDPATNPLADGQAPFQDYVVLGNPSNLEPDTSATSASHPLNLLAATYLLYFGELQNRNPKEQAGPFYLEITSGGMRPSDMQPTRGFTLEQAVNRQYWYEAVLNSMANQKADEAWDWPTPPGVANWLAWRALRESVRGLAVRSEGYSARTKVWKEISAYFHQNANDTGNGIAQFGTVISRDVHHLVYNVSMEEMEDQAKGYERRALRAVRRVQVPNFNENVSWQDAARGAAEIIALKSFNLLENLASTSITRGAAAQNAKVGSSTVFLPPGVHNPTGDFNDIARKPLNNLDGLIHKYAGVVEEAINMPDPQARRYQFKITMEQALEEYIRARSKATWDATEPLAQFTALLEGVLFGSLDIQLFDLMSYGFQPKTFDRRILGVLIDGSGDVYGGTDPETLFFPAPGSWDRLRGPLYQISGNNVTLRDTEAGKYARVLLKKFRDTFDINNRPLWLRMIDEYLHIYEPHGVHPTDSVLKGGWKQAGPVQIRLPNGKVEPRYLPLYQSDFTSHATSALSGEFLPRDNEVQLKVNGSDAGKISYPDKVSAGLTLRLMGAGSISTLPNPRVLSTKHINYTQLRERCVVLIGDNEAQATAAEVESNPFKYADLIRLPFQHDGFLAEYFLQGGKANERYGQGFLDTVRGRGISALPALKNDQHAPAQIRDQKDYYFIDESAAVYVEKYDGREVRELSLLGQVLWTVFIGEATQVADKNIFIDADGNVILEYTDWRMMPGPTVSLTQPSEQMKAAELRCLASRISQADIDPLFREAVNSWLEFFHLHPMPGPCARTQIRIGTKTWWRP